MLKKNPAMKSLLLTLLPGKTPNTLAGTACRKISQEMWLDQKAQNLQAYSTMYSMFVYVCSLHQQPILSEDRREVYLCCSITSDYEAFC